MPSESELFRPTSAAEAAYREYLRLVQDGGDPDFDEFCASRGSLERELRQLHEERQTLRYVPPVVSTDFGERLTRQYQRDPEGRLAEMKDAHVLRQLASTPQQRYLLQGEIARGGMGAILKVWDGHLRRNLAMKVILGSEAAPNRGEGGQVSARMLTRFLEEAQITGQLDHPGVVPVHELGIDDGGQVYFTMRLVKGRDFNAIIKLARGNLDGWTPSRALSTLLKVCETMAYAHSKGVVHRDLKPENLMVGRFGEAYVMDWGLSKVVGTAAGEPTSLIDVDRGATDPEDLLAVQTQHGSVLGTPCYMSPEQAHGRLDLIGPASDVYSMGCVLYQLLTGSPPYMPEGSSPSPIQVLQEVRRGPPIPIAKAAPNVSPELVAICEKAMAREIGDRYPTMLQMGEDLRAFLEGRVVKAYETGAFAELRKLVVRNKAAAAAVILALGLAIAGLLAIALVSRARAREVEEEQRRTLEARNEAEANLAKLRREKYVTNLIAAAASLRDDEVHEAKRHLDDCAEDQRGWEWQHLRWRADSSLRRFEHGQPVQSVALDPEGRRVVTACDDGAVRIWDARSGERLRELRGHPGAVRAVAFAGGRVFSFGDWNDSQARVWDPASGEAVVNLHLEGHAPYAFAVRADGGAIAYVTEEQQIAVIDVSGSRQTELPGHAGTVHALAFDPSGRRLLSGGEDGRVLVWDLDSGQVGHELPCEGAVVHSVAASPVGGEIAAGLDDGTVLRWSLPAVSGQPVTKLAPLRGHRELVYGVAYGPDGSRLASASVDKTVRLWDAASGRELAVLRGHERSVRCVAFSGDGARLATGSDDGTARVWSPQPAGIVELTMQGASPSAVAASADAVVLGSEHPALIERHTLAAGPSLLVASFDDAVTSLALNADGTVAAAGFREACRVRIFDLRRDQRFELDRQPASVTSVAFFPDGHRVVSGSDDGTVRVFDIASRKLLREMGGLAPITAVAVRHDGHVAAASVAGAVGIWDESGERVRTLEVRDAVISALAYRPDGAYLAAGGEDGRLWIWSDAAAEPTELAGHDRAVTAVAFSPDSTRLVSGSQDSTLRIWDARFESAAEGGRLLLTLRQHGEPVTDVAFSADGKRLVSTSDDGKALIWEAR